MTRFIIKTIGWIKSVTLPLLAGLLIGLLILKEKEDTLGIIIALSISVLGLVIGLIFRKGLRENKAKYHNSSFLILKIIWQMGFICIKKICWQQI